MNYRRVGQAVALFKVAGKTGSETPSKPAPKPAPKPVPQPAPKLLGWPGTALPESKPLPSGVILPPARPFRGVKRLYDFLLPGAMQLEGPGKLTFGKSFKF